MTQNVAEQFEEEEDLAVAETRRRNLESIARNLGPTVVEALQKPLVIEVMLNSDGKIWIEEFGKGMFYSGQRLSSIKAETALSVIASMLGTAVNRESPILEGELPLDGSRFEGLMAPVVEAPCFAIRKPASKVFTLADFEKQGVLTNRDDPLNANKSSHVNFARLCQGRSHAEVLRLAIQMKKNIVVIGGTGSGKTTLVNAIIDAMATLTKDRLVLIEDTREIQCRAENVVLMRTSENVNMQRLLRATLRLRPDRIIVGEVRGAEVLALLTAWNTGHPGGLTTIHADSAAEGLTRMEQMMELGGVPPNPKLIASLAHVVVFIEKETKVSAGRKVREIALVTGYDAVKQQYQFQYV